MLGAKSRVLGEEHPETLTSTTIWPRLSRTNAKYAAAEVMLYATVTRRRMLGDARSISVCYKPRPPAATTVTSMLPLRIVALSHMGQPERELPLACQRLLLGLGTSSKGAPRTRSHS
jgi:hypothetical protein